MTRRLNHNSKPQNMKTSHTTLLAMGLTVLASFTVRAELKWSYKLNDIAVPATQVVADGTGGVAFLVPTYHYDDGYKLDGADIIWLDANGREIYKKHRVVDRLAGQPFFSIITVTARRLVYMV